MYLIIAEKRSAAEKVGSCIKGESFKKGDGFIQSQNYYITWCAGHLYTLLDLEEYDPNYDPNEKHKWTMDGLPFCPPRFRYKVSQPKGNASMCATVRKQTKVIKKLANDASVSAIYHCGDSDREGEVIVRNAVRALLKSNKPIYRIWLNSYTTESVMKALSAKEPDSNYDGWDNAGLARAHEDWLFGINGTRYLSLKSGVLLPWGRCKYIITKAIVDRERAITNFVPVDYFAVVSKTNVKGYDIELASKKTFDKDSLPDAAALANRYNAAGAKVTSVKKDRVTVNPGRLFSTTELQAFVSSHYKGTDPKEIEASLEELYQSGYTTYPRTNSSFLTASDEHDVDLAINALKRAGFQNLVNKPKKKSIYDDSKVDGHSALTPTSNIPDISKLSPAQRITYECIRNRFLAVFCSEDCLADKTVITIRCDDEDFHLTGTINVAKGWLQYEPFGQKDKEVPPLNDGESVPVDFKPVKKQTAPPKRFTVASFGAWCNAPWRNEDDSEKTDYTDEEWKRILHGIGSISITRVVTPPVGAESVYQAVAGVVKSVSRPTQREIIKAIKDKRNGYKLTGLTMGRRVEASLIHHNDGKCFSKSKSPEDVPELCVGVLLDQSGSTMGEIINYERLLALTIEDMCRSIEIPAIINGYSGGGGTVRIISYVEPNSVDRKNALRLTSMRADGGTPTAEALAYMLNRLEKRSEPSKILFVVTDGNSNNKAYLPMLLAEAKRNHIMVIAAGIGACRQSIHSEFPENFLDISDMNSMPRNICNIIKRKLVN